MARIRLAILGAALAFGLSPASARAEFDATADAHRAAQAAAQARKADRAAAEQARSAPTLDPVYEPTFGEWLDATGAGRNRMILWMGGVYSGLAWSNIELAARGQAPIFCPPPQVRVTGQDVVNLVTAQARGGVQISRNHLLGGVVVSALKTAFPCPAAP
jgi:type II secretory pathway pseudopilin PulG